MRLRRASLPDISFVYLCNNHPSTRAVSRQSDPIPTEDHIRWFSARLADPDCELFIIEEGQSKAGVLRLQRSAGAVEISLSLLPNMRTKGLGAAAIQEACRGQELPVVAWIWERNEASLRCFSRCGFVKTEDSALNGEKLFLCYRRTSPH